MKIEKTNQALFKAQFINPIKIGKLADNKYIDESISFIKLDPFNHNDITALKDCSQYWVNGGFALNIYYALCAIKEKSKFYIDHNVYGLTSQKSDFDNLNSRNILGLVHTSPYLDSPLFIEHIQTNPEFLGIKKPEYKGIGTAILNSLKKISDQISCFPASGKSVKDFYKKNGFKKQPNSSNFYTWERDKYDFDKKELQHNLPAYNLTPIESDIKNKNFK